MSSERRSIERNMTRDFVRRFRPCRLRHIRQSNDFGRCNLHDGTHETAAFDRQFKNCDAGSATEGPLAGPGSGLGLRRYHYLMPVAARTCGVY